MGNHKRYLIKMNIFTQFLKKKLNLISLKIVLLFVKNINMMIYQKIIMNIIFMMMKII